MNKRILKIILWVTFLSIYIFIDCLFKLIGWSETVDDFFATWFFVILITIVIDWLLHKGEHHGNI